MFCTNCGASLPDDASFCTTCGARVAADVTEPMPAAPMGPAPATPPDPPRRHAGAVVAVVVAVAILAAGGVGAMWFLGVGPFAAEEGASGEEDPAEGREGDEAPEPDDGSDDADDRGAAAGDEGEGRDGGAPEREDEGPDPDDEGHTLTETGEGTVYRNEAYGFAFTLPETTEPVLFIKDGEGRECGVRAADSASGLDVEVTARDNDRSSLEEVMADESAGRPVHYSASGDDWFVISWDEGSTVYYLREFVGPTRRVSVLYTYPKSASDTGDAAVEATYDTLEPGDLGAGR